MERKKFYLVSLGCAKNTVDSERVAKLLSQKFEPTNDPTEADLILVNTCAFIDPAKEESIETIIDLSRVKKREAKLAVFGCLVNRYGEVLKRELHEADLLFPTEPYREVCQTFDLKSCDLKKRLLLTPPTYAYLKISEGCNRTCAFCAIPQIRGPYRSRPVEELVEEARYLVETYGVKELVIVSQDTSYYGKDLYGEFALPRLLDELQKLPVKWIRLHYLYPSKEVFALVDYLLKGSEKVLPYLDLPIQHASDRVLKAMRRGHSADFLKKLLHSAREKLGENAVFRTTVIVGFPAEGQKEFEELLKFVEEFEFDYLGVFKYYHEEGTPAWETFEDSVPEEEKEERKRTLEAVQSVISERRLSRFLETEQEVLVEGVDEDFGLVPVGRTWFQAPEVDGMTYLETFSPDGEEFKPEVGKEIKAFLTQLEGVDFKAVPLGD
ncbi:MAG: 30S ribosomal protein S12 methylthiotransferase RimO [Aquificae bacterium]|nr:30S ribosomal protein S12 methylthiotransferase RimO [Aquificota bacterium]